MPNPTKLVNNVEVEMTDEEVAQGVADAEAYDLNLYSHGLLLIR